MSFDYDYEQFKREKKDDEIICDKCGCNTFLVYISVIIDDARLYCSNCGSAF